MATMKSNAPWSVKGIARDTRETAKEAARKEGMTVGEWLNHIIHQAGAGEFNSEGDVSGMQLRDLATAIEHLNNKFGRQDETTLSNLSAITNSLEDVVERIQRIEHVGTGADTGNGDGSLSVALDERLSKLEHKANDSDRINALRALEKAVGQVAAQFDRSQKASMSRIESTENNLQEFVERLDNIDSGIAKLSESGGAPIAAGAEGADQQTITALTDRLSALENGTAQTDNITDPHFAERTGKRLRVLGDEIKRSGDQIRSLETLISKLSDQIDAAEQRSSDGVQKVTETVAALQAKLAGNSIADNSIAGSPLNSTPQNSSELNAGHTEKTDALGGVTQETNEQVSAPESKTQPKFGKDNAFDPQEQKDRDPESVDSTDEDFSENLLGDFGEELVPSDLDADNSQADHNTNEATTQTHATPTGSLYEEEDSEISVEGDFDNAFDDIEFSDDTVGDLDADEPVSARHDGDVDINLDDEQDDATRIAAEINQLLNDAPEESNQTAEAVPQESLSVDNLLEDDPFAAPEETLATPPDLSFNEPRDKEDDFSFDSFDKDDPEAAPITPEPLSEVKPVDKTKSSQSAGKLPRTPEGKIDIAKLTPKQKAILAARARKKREASQSPEKQEQQNPARKKRAKATQDPTYESYDERNHVDTKRSSLMDRVRGLLPGSKNLGDFDDAEPEISGSKKKDDALDVPENNEAIRNPFFRNGRPSLTLMLLGAFLFLCLLMFLARPLFSDRNKVAEPVPASASVAPPPTRSEVIDNATLLETPAADAGTIRPRQLFLESMAILGGSDAPNVSSPTDEITEAAFQDLIKAASLGYPPAQFQLGEFYKNGTWTERDSSRARTWFHRSAEGGNVYAMHRLGYLYAEGEGGSADIVTAIQKFEEAANLGFVDSQFNLGAIYDPGPGNTPLGIQDIEQAYYWFALAALNGDNQAGNRAADIGSRLTEEQKATIESDIADWRAGPVNVSANENLSDS